MLAVAFQEAFVLIKSDEMQHDQVLALLDLMEGELNRAGVAPGAERPLSIASISRVHGGDGRPGEKSVVQLNVDNLTRPVSPALVIQALEIMGVRGIIRFTDQPKETA